MFSLFSDRNSILKDIYKTFTIRQISYACFGSPFYLNTSDVGDIDILVAEKDFEQACEVIISMFGRLSGGILFSNESPSAGLATAKKYFFATSAQDPAILQIDIFTSYHWRGMNYFSYHDALNHLNTVDDVVVCDPRVTILVGAFKDMVYGGKIKDSRIVDGYKRQDLITFFPTLGYRPSLLQVFLKNYDNQKYRSLAFFRMWLGKSRLQDIRNLFHYFVNIVKLYTLPNRRRSLIAFYGPDGGGKSSVIDIVASSPIVLETFGRVVVRHTRPHIIPPISKWMPNSRSEKKHKSVVARSVVPINRAKAAISVFYYGMDFLLEKVFLMSVPFSRTKTLYIYDRYVFEFGYQQTFSKLPLRLLRFLKYISLKPSVNYFLSADSKIIISRKSELKKSEIDVQNSSFKELDQRHSLDSVFIDTGLLNQKAAADKVLRCLSKRLS